MVGPDNVVHCVRVLYMGSLVEARCRPGVMYHRMDAKWARLVDCMTCLVKRSQ